MDHLVSLAQHTTPLWTPSEMLCNAKQIGYNFVSIRAIPQGVLGERYFDLVNDKKQFIYTKEAMKNTGVGINDIDLVAIRNDYDVKQCEATLEIAASLGVKGVVCSVWTPDRYLYTEQFAQLCDLANQYGLCVHLEFVTWAEINNLASAAELLKITRKSNARILVDMIHMYRSQVSVEELASLPQEWFELLHICDAPKKIPKEKKKIISSCRSERLYPGEGCLDMHAVLRNVLPSAVLSIEIPNAKRHSELGAYEHAYRCLQTTKEYLHIT